MLFIFYFSTVGFTWISTELFIYPSWSLDYQTQEGMNYQNCWINFALFRLKMAYSSKRLLSALVPSSKKKIILNFKGVNSWKKMGFFKLRKPHPSWTDPNWFVCWYQCPKRFWTSPRYLLNVTKHWLLLGICVRKKVFMTNLNFIYQVPTCKKSEKIKELLLYQLLKLT